jgi:hypothetical protein
MFYFFSTLEILLTENPMEGENSFGKMEKVVTEKLKKIFALEQRLQSLENQMKDVLCFNFLP